MDIGFIGLGNMGAAVAANLVAAGHRAGRAHPHVWRSATGFAGMLGKKESRAPRV